MKQSRIVMGLFALMIAFTISSCKDDEDPVANKSKTELLTQNTWKIKSGTPSDDFFVAITVASQAEITYKKDGTYTSTSLLDSDPSTGKWAFNTEETKITTDLGASDETIAEIIKLDASTLELKYTESGSTFTLVFAKK